MNSIPEQQNQPQQLEQLGSFSQLYLQAKRMLTLNTILSVPMVIVWAFLVAVWSSLEVYAALWGITVTLLGVLVITPRQKKLQATAAQVQQLFDCELFQLDWNDFNVGSPPPPEIIIQANQQYIRRVKTYDRLKDWYDPAIKPLPLELARLVCQRTNCWWDSDLRRRYSGWVIALLSILTVGVLLIGFIGGLTLPKFLLAVVAPLLPAIILGITQYRENMQTAETLDRLREQVQEVWASALYKQTTSLELYDASVKLQDAIFDNRTQSPLIFNWFYRHLRTENQTLMNKSTQTLVEEALKAKGINL
ncbi:hypothetical protein Lepto7375DRAFT_1071 [Leptolyngbya sp. PCC 7375]|nr:hypothetical protein Lepto7375DRAFT_1071 [Leptolyngbya sp. PCC 7375]